MTETIYMVEIHETINGRRTVKYIADDTCVYPIYTTNFEYVKIYTSVKELHDHMNRLGVDCYNVTEITY